MTRQIIATVLVVVLAVVAVAAIIRPDIPETTLHVIHCADVILGALAVCLAAVALLSGGGS